MKPAAETKRSIDEMQCGVLVFRRNVDEKNNWRNAAALAAGVLVDENYFDEIMSTRKRIDFWVDFRVPIFGLNTLFDESCTLGAA